MTATNYTHFMPSLLPLLPFSQLFFMSESVKYFEFWAHGTCWRVNFRNWRDLTGNVFNFTLVGDNSKSLIKDGYVINSSVKSLKHEPVIWAGLSLSFYSIAPNSFYGDWIGKVLLCCVWPHGNLTLIHLPTCVSGYRKLKDGDTSVLTPSLLHEQRDGQLIKVFFIVRVTSNLGDVSVNNQIS